MRRLAKIKPHPQYAADLRGLLAWLGQPPSSFSAVGWQNAPEWKRALEAYMLKSTADFVITKRERDEARRDACAFEVINRWNEAHPKGIMSPGAARCLAREIAVERGWDCFQYDVLCVEVAQ